MTALLTLGVLQISTIGKGFMAKNPLCCQFCGVTEMGLGKEQRKKQALTPLLLHHFRLFSQKWLIYGCCSQRGPSPVRNTAAYFPGMMSQEPWQRPKPGASEGEPSGRLHGVGIVWEEGWDSNRQVGCGHLR